MQQNDFMNPMMLHPKQDKKSGAFVTLIIVLIIVILAIYLSIRNGSPTEDLPNNQIVTETTEQTGDVTTTTETDPIPAEISAEATAGFTAGDDTTSIEKDLEAAKAAEGTQ